MSITLDICTSTKTTLIGSFRVPVDILPKYTLIFGYDKETAITKIKQLIKDIKSGDFTQSSIDYGHPEVVAKANQWYYAHLKGLKSECFLKTDSHWAYCVGAVSLEMGWEEVL